MTEFEKKPAKIARELKHCPFCGRRLLKIDFENKVEGKENVLFFLHEKGDCLLSYFKLFPDEIEKWERRENNG